MGFIFQNRKDLGFLMGLWPVVSLVDCIGALFPLAKMQSFRLVEDLATVSYAYALPSGLQYIMHVTSSDDHLEATTRAVCGCVST